MAGANKNYMVDIDLDKSGIHRSFYNRPIGRKDAEADHFGVRVYRNGTAFQLSGIQIQGYFINPVGEHIAITDSDHCKRDGNSAWVILPQACYNYEGQFQLSLKLVGGGVTGTVRIIDGTVCNTGADGAVAPTAAIPSYQEVLAEYNEAIAMTDSFNALKNSIVKYVDANGDDGNDGDGPATSGNGHKAYATIGAAIAAGARTIYVAKGSYTEHISSSDTSGYRYGSIKIVGNHATLTSDGASCMTFRFCNVYISGFDFVMTNPPVWEEGAHAGEPKDTGCLELMWCTGVVSDCTAHGGNHGFRLDGSRVSYIRCKSSGNVIDGFNGHAQTDSGYTYQCDATLINCEAYSNGDDGASTHEYSTLNIIGGAYYDNLKAGIAPWQWCKYNIIGANCYGNGSGIISDNPSWSSGDKGSGVITGCIIKDNTKTGSTDGRIGYGIYVNKYNVEISANTVSGNAIKDVYCGSAGTLTDGQLTEIVKVEGEISDLKQALISNFDNIVTEIGRVPIALEASNLVNMGVSTSTGEQQGTNDKRVSNINLFSIVPNMPLYIENGSSFLKPYVFYFKNGAFVNYDSSYTVGKSYDADAIRLMFFKNPSTSTITPQEVVSGFTIYQKASSSYRARLEAAEEKYPDIDNRFCDFQIPFRFGQLNTSTGAILPNDSVTNRLVSKLTKKGLFKYIVRTETGINFYVGYYNASKVFQKAVGWNTGAAYLLEDYPYISIMAAHTTSSLDFTSVDIGLYLSETDSVQTIQKVVEELDKNKHHSLVDVDFRRLTQFVSTPSEDADGNTVITCEGGDSFTTAGQWAALWLSKTRTENISNKFMQWDKILIKWDGDSEYSQVPMANCSCFVNTSFTFTGKTDIEPGKLVLVDNILANYTDGEVYFGLNLAPVFAPSHVYQDGSTWHIDPFTAKFVSFVADNVYAGTRASIADQLSNGLTGEKIAFAIENNGANDYSLIAYGDSLTTGAGATDADHTYWGVCASVLNMKNRIGFGYGGSQSRPIAFTAGALTGYVPPSTRSFALKFADLTTDISINANVLNGKTVIIEGQEYTIGQTGATAYTLPDGYTPKSYWVPATVKNSRYTADVYIIWVGTNDGGMQWDIVDAMIAKLPHKRYVVMGLTRLGTDTSIEDEKKGYEKYGSHYLNIRIQIINSAFAIIGKTPTAEDTTAMNAGLMPPSLMSDATHFNDDGYEAIGKILAKHIQSLGYSYQTAQ